MFIALFILLVAFYGVMLPFFVACLQSRHGRLI